MFLDPYRPILYILVPMLAWVSANFARTLSNAIFSDATLGSVLHNCIIGYTIRRVAVFQKYVQLSSLNE